MNKGWMIIGFIACLGLGFLGGSLYYFEKPGSVDWGKAYQVSEIVGTYVKNLEGAEYGKISDMVVDTSGRVPFAVLSYGEKSVAVPFGALMFDREGDDLVLDLPRKILDSAPAFDKSQLANRTWVEDNFRHFGQAPYWTEAQFGKEMEEFPSDTPDTGYASP